MGKWWPVGLVLSRWRLWLPEVEPAEGALARSCWDGCIWREWNHLGQGSQVQWNPLEMMRWVAVGAPIRAERKEDRRVPGASLLFMLLGAVGRSVPVGGFRLLLSVGGRGWLKRIRLVGLTKWLWLTLVRFGKFFSFQRVLTSPVIGVGRAPFEGRRSRKGSQRIARLLRDDWAFGVDWHHQVLEGV